MISPSCQPLDLPGQPNRMEDEEAESGCDEDELQDAAGSKDMDNSDRHASRHENQRHMNCLGVMDAMMLHKAGSFTFEVSSVTGPSRWVSEITAIARPD